MTALALWGGMECTVNRVGSRYFDQLTRTGHLDRPDDLDRFYALGLRTLRFPLLWEHVAPDGLDHARWQWADERVTSLRRLGMRPIVGLVHHGSGPPSTSLVDESFVSGLAEYAGAIARRYPWIDAYTPVNEPLTTARFSGLYGHWYPHRRDDRAFAAALVNQVRATRAAMRAIRAVNPRAQLVQTEDICSICGTPPLRAQVEFENNRRWLSLDLLAGTVTRQHPLREFLVGAGVSHAMLDDLAHDPCPPDIIGLNYYLTSDRFLDHRIERRHLPSGGNGRQRYVDADAVRVPGVGLTGHERHLHDAFERYRQPVALTEVHAACSREEQVRWLAEAWEAAVAARARGVDVIAVTAWSLLGAYDWDSLVTRDEGSYESGVFDVRSVPPRPTVLARVIRDLSTTGRMTDLPVLDAPGWWRRMSPADEVGVVSRPVRRNREHERRLLIVGRRGTLGRALARACDDRALAHVLAGRETIDIADITSVAAAIRRFSPWAIINAAGYVDVDAAERDAERCYRENTRGAQTLAIACAAQNIRLVTFSSDLVFDGRRATPYVESDLPAPLNIYGSSKQQAEAQVLDYLPEALVVRTSAFFGPDDGANFITQSLRRVREGRTVPAADDVTISATYVPELAHVTLDLLIDEEHGIWHLSNPGAVTWADLARLAIERAGFDPRLIAAAPAASMGWSAARPRYSALGSVRGSMMQPLDRAVDAYFAALNQRGSQEAQSCA